MVGGFVGGGGVVGGSGGGGLAGGSVGSLTACGGGIGSVPSPPLHAARLNISTPIAIDCSMVGVVMIHPPAMVK